jgi:hypothetical protein
MTISPMARGDPALPDAAPAADQPGGPATHGGAAVADALDAERRFRSIVASVPMGLHRYRLEPPSLSRGMAGRASSDPA